MTSVGVHLAFLNGTHKIEQRNDLYHLHHGPIVYIYGVLRRVNVASVKMVEWALPGQQGIYIHGDHASETRLRLDRGRFSNIA